MAYDGRFTSIKPVIESVYRDSGAEEINFEVAIEDAAELVGLMGIPYTYIDKQTNGIDGVGADIITVEDYRAFLPNDLAYLINMRKVTLDGNRAIAYSEEMIESNSLTHYDRLENLPDPDYVYPIANSPINDFAGNSFKTTLAGATFRVYEPVKFSGTVFGGVNTTDTYYIKSIINPTEFTVSKIQNGSTLVLIAATGSMTVTNQTSGQTLIVTETTIQDDSTLITTGGTVNGERLIGNRLSPYTYKINNGAIFTSFEKGFINMQYKAYPIDSEGFLMVPDDEKFRAALKYHIMYKLDFRRWRSNPASPGLKALLNDSEQRRDFYVGAARNKAHIPSIDGMEAIKNQWLRSIPKINHHSDGFASMNKIERRNF